MGLDLSLLTTFGHFPVDYVKRQKDFYVVNRLRLSQEYQLFDAISMEVPKHLLPMSINDKGDEGIMITSTDSYGQKLTYCRAGDLFRLSGRGWCEWNEAVLGFFNAIDPETWVVIHWE